MKKTKTLMLTLLWFPFVNFKAVDGCWCLGVGVGSCGVGLWVVVAWGWWWLWAGVGLALVLVAGLDKLLDVSLGCVAIKVIG